MIADSEDMHYNNPVNIKYTWKKEVQHVCGRVSCVSKAIQDDFGLLTWIHQI